MEEFAAQVQKLADDVRREVEVVRELNTEAATKQFLVLPFMQTMGYSGAADVVPEFTAAFGTKKDDKVDYALMHDGSSSILIECKKVDSTLGTNEHSQLMGYFAAVPEARFGILTNGLVYQFYSDLEKPNVMDDHPFLTFDVRDLDAQDVETLEILKALTKDEFDVDKARSAARRAIDKARRDAQRTKFRTLLEQVLQEELSEQPTEEFLAFMRGRVDADGQSDLTQDELDSLIRHVCKNFINKEPRVPTEYEPRVHSDEVEGVPSPEPQQERVVELGGRVVVEKCRVVVGPTAQKESLRGKSGTLLYVKAVMVHFDEGFSRKISPRNLRLKEPYQGMPPSGEPVVEVEGGVVVEKCRVVVGPTAQKESLRGKSGTLSHAVGVIVHFDEGFKYPVSPTNLRKVGR